jgi:carbon storage regulator
MLVLNRGIGERICIGDAIVLTVVGTSSGQVRLGIEAPPTVRVLREELQSVPVAREANCTRRSRREGPKQGGTVSPGTV